VNVRDLVAQNDRELSTRSCKFIVIWEAVQTLYTQQLEISAGVTPDQWWTRRNHVKRELPVIEQMQWS